MSTLQLLTISTVLALILVVLAIVYLRVKGPHSKQLSAEQARIDAKTRASGRTPATATNRESITGKAVELVASNIWTILLALACAGLLWWLYQSNLTVVQVTTWVWEHMLFALAATVVASIALSCFPKAKWAWWIPVAITAGIMVTHWVNSPASPKKHKLTISMPPHGYSDHVVPPVGRAVDYKGHGYVIHVVYADGHECIVGMGTCKDGHILYTYLQNTINEENVATYAFVRGK